MHLEQIWAPWRLGYIQGDDKPARTPLGECELLDGADPECFICRAVAQRLDRPNLVIDRGKYTVTLLNRYPYNNGHLLIAPLAHKGGLDALTEAEHQEIGAKLTQMTGLLQQLIKAEGFNIGLNLGPVAGAGLPGHLHWHIVPRWSGDTNFMPTLAGVHVIPQSLDALWESMTQSLAHMANE